MALAALQAGRAALAAGDPAGAIEWLERARRYAPDNPDALLSLAAARFADGDMQGAAEAFRSVAASSDVREAWLAAAAAALRLGQVAAAVAAMGRCLSRHRWDGLAGMPDAVVAAAGLPGWCALAAEGTVATGLARPGRCRVVADGLVIRTGGTVPPSCRAVDVTLGGVKLLGSPLDAAAIHRVDGAVAADGAGLAGWAWHPGDAERDPVLTLSDGRMRRQVTATDQAMTALRPLARARRFVLGAADLAEFSGPVSVTGSDGAALSGSPVDVDAPTRGAAALARCIAARWPLCGEPAPADDLIAAASMPAAIVGRPAQAPACPERRVSVVVPVYRGLPETLACLAALQATLPPDSQIVVVDDAAPEPGLPAALDALAATGAVQLLRLPANLGFPGAANAGLRHAARLLPECDLVLLNSDAVPTPGWLQRLRAAVHAAPDIGTATPLSNDASILSYPDKSAGNPAPEGQALAALARHAAAANAGVVVDIPTAIGFCMYIRLECLQQTGLFREDAFAQGYGEENDFCLRARALGWRHVAVPGAYVAHLGGRSFGAGRAALLARNIEVLERLHPGYAALIADWMAADPLQPARRRLDARRWRTIGRQGARGGTTLLVTHDSAGGVERCVQARVVAIQAEGGRPLLLRPVVDRSGRAATRPRRYRPGLCRIDEPGQHLPNLLFRLPDELPALATLLRTVRPRRMEVHHLLGHEHAVLDLARLLAIPYEIRLHDYFWFCPRVNLLGAGDRYCGEPQPAGCVACIADLGSRLEEEIGVPALLVRSARDLAGAARVVAPCADAAHRLARHFPGVLPQVVPHEVDADAAIAQPPPARGEAVICVAGAIGPEKGFDVLLACARDAASRRLPLRFVVVGHTVDDARLLDTGRVRVTGPYRAAEAAALIRAQRATAGFIPSICPETWCLALGEVWSGGLNVFAFDLGAPAERIRATGRGWLLPLGLPAARVNNAFLTLRPLAGRRLAGNDVALQTG